MKIVCRICGNEFDHPDNKRGTKPSVCPSKECQATQSREYQAKWARDKRAGISSDTKRCRRCGEQFTSEGNGRICPQCADKPKPVKIAPAKPKPDTSKAGWPEDTKKCVDCGQFFMDDGRSRLCPVCKAAKKEERYSTKRKETTKPAIVRPEPLHLKSVDEVLKEAKAAGYSPEEYGKYKAAKALEKAGPIDINLVGTKPALVTLDPALVVEENKKAIDEKMKEDEMICKECGFDVEPVEFGDAVECPACGKVSESSEALFEAERDEPVREGSLRAAIDRSGVDDMSYTALVRRRIPNMAEIRRPFKFLNDIEILAKMMIDDELTPDEILPLAQKILDKGLHGLNPTTERPETKLDPAWGFDRNLSALSKMGGSK